MPAPAYSRKRKAAFFSMLLLTLALATFALFEFTARVLDPLGVSYYPKTAAYMATMVMEEPLGYRNRPNLRGNYYGVPVRINSRGLRDREIEQHPAPDEFRVLVLGDSMPFGIGVDYEHSIPFLLERQIQTELAGSGLRFRTINGGTISYNTEQERIQLEHIGLALEPKLVTLIYIVNDIQPKMWVFHKRRQWHVRLLERSYTACLAALAYKRLTGLGPVGSLTNEFVQDDPGWIRSDESLTRIQEICRKSGIPFVVFTFEPMPLVEGVGAREGFPVISLHASPYWTREQKRPEAYVNSPLDSHPNPEGSEIYARLMYEGLAAASVLPAAVPGAGAPTAVAE